MPSFDEAPIRALLEVVAPTYQALDLRIAAAKIDGVWTVAAGTLVARHSQLAQVQEIHASLADTLSLPQAEGFDFRLYAAPAAELFILLQGISDGVLAFDGHEFVLDAVQDTPDKSAEAAKAADTATSTPSNTDEGPQTAGTTATTPDTEEAAQTAETTTTPSYTGGSDEKPPQPVRPWSPIWDQAMKGSHRLSVPDEDGFFPRYLYGIQTGRVAEEVFADAGVDPSHLQFESWQELDAWIGFPYFDPNKKTRINLQLAFPIYAALDRNPIAPGGVLHLTARAHGHLQGQLRGRARVQAGDQSWKGSPPLAIPPPEHPEGINTFSVRLPLDPFGWGPHHAVSARLFHDQLGTLEPVASTRYGYLNSSPPDPLLTALRHFGAHELIQSFLADRRQPKGNPTYGPFEAGVVWLLGMLRFRTVPLFLWRDAESLKVGDANTGSADILAHDPEFGLVIVDCTRSIPPLEKGAKLRQTALDLAEVLNEPVRCAVTAPVRLTMLRAAWGSHGVALIDNDDLTAMRELADGGNLDQARARFTALIDNLAAVGDL